MKKILLVFCLLIFGCGYKPLSKVSKNILGDKIYSYVSTSINDPQNSVIIQDALKEAIVSRFGGSLVPRQKAESILHVNIKSVNFIPTIYDQNGYVVSYKAKLILETKTTFANGQTSSYDARGEYDFDIQANSVISDSKRFKAIKLSSLSALDEYIAFIAVKGMRD
ncbi:MAG: hypothetical protein CR967_03430 [Proteobacteria bacterium]|nr:MAG: hypothetical protein CR967_03430 [Pseudomonadota bacterium]